MDVSVIIPVYGVAGFVERCTESLMRQSMREGVEFIFVDDATPDDSIALVRKVVERHPERAAQVRILTHEANQGLPAARNTGLKAARGEFVIQFDGDDFAEPTMIEDLYAAVKNNNADFAWSDYYITFENKKRIIKQPDYKTPIEAVRGMLRGSMKYNVWNKICRLSIYKDNSIEFPAGNAMGEDITMIMLALHSRKCAYVEKPLYNYVQNQGQMTATFNEEKLNSLRYNCNRIREYINNKFPNFGLESESAALNQLMKWPFLLDGKYSSYRRWHEWFPESNKYIWQTKGVNKRIKFIEWCAANHLYPIVWLHYIIVIKLYYGIVYGK